MRTEEETQQQQKRRWKIQPNIANSLNNHFITMIIYLYYVFSIYIQILSNQISNTFSVAYNIYTHSYILKCSLNHSQPIWISYNSGFSYSHCTFLLMLYIFLFMCYVYAHFGSVFFYFSSMFLELYVFLFKMRICMFNLLTYILSVFLFDSRKKDSNDIFLNK